ncbi:MAG: tail fiber protein [Oligoflexus sp.]|jgi:microcystin-dependent protein
MDKDTQIQKDTRYRLGLLLTPIAALFASSRLVAQSSDANDLKKTLAILTAKLEQLSGSLVPAGTIIAFAGGKVPSGWLLCDGQAYPDQQYPQLSLALERRWNTAAKQDGFGGNHGSPGGGQFRVPDLRGVFLRGVGLSSRSDGSGDVQVELAKFYNDDNLSHDHAVNDNGHDHLSYYSGSSGGIFWGADNVVMNNTPGGARRTDPAKTGITLSNSGGAESRPRSVGVQYLIKT